MVIDAEDEGSPGAAVSADAVDGTGAVADVLSACTPADRDSINGAANRGMQNEGFCTSVNSRIGKKPPLQQNDPLCCSRERERAPWSEESDGVGSNKSGHLCPKSARAREAREAITRWVELAKDNLAHAYTYV